MKLYRKYIRPMHSYPGQYYEPKTEPIEKEEKWYPEEEREYLENKYGYLNKRSFSDLIFEEKYEPYDALELLKEISISPDWFCADGKKDGGQMKRPKETFWDSMSEVDLMEPMHHFED